ncbi:MAG: hypothetical protein LBT46_06345 [Planctomycetaceae bacterium]|nr:hypothetical protein [Planctomycetaceae bacterium]
MKKTKLLNASFSFGPGKSYAINIPSQILNDAVTTSLTNISEYYEAIRGGEVKKLLAVSGFRERPRDTIYIHFTFSKKTLRSVVCEQLLNKGRYACCLLFNEQGQLQQYLLGLLMKVKENENIQAEVTGQPQYQIDGSGIEVKFHPTGYPASYKTIVKNRLFGRQIAWNAKGEVISDVDLDIPRPWTDAPKKPAAPVVMRTWTSSGGKYHIRAEYVSADENQVILKNEEGKVFPVALSKLSTDDQNYVKEQLEVKPELPKREK